MSQFKFDPAKLDFAQIKAALKANLEATGTFNDYDFDGSALDALLDVLALNTHLNALTANFATNEAFLDTAQLRGSVVSHAKPLNYLPRSRRSSKATITMALQSVPDATDDIVIPKYTEFYTSIDGVVYPFYTLDEYTATSANSYTVTADLYEGKKIRKRFIVDSDSYPMYVIPDSKADTSTFVVSVREGLNSSNSETYSIPTIVSELTALNTNYFLNESPNGYYEIMFGDGLIGKLPPAGSVVEIDYLKSSGALADNANTFSSSATVEGYSITSTTVTKALGGAEREGIASIRFNAPKSFAAQSRAVTVSDYKTFIQSGVSYVETLNVWGGEDNDPPEYGTVFIAIKPVGANALTAAQKTQLVDVVLDSKNIITITPKIVDPDFQYIEVRMNVRYEPKNTALTQAQLENKIKDSIVEYGSINLATFDSSFRLSRLMSYIDDSDLSVVAVSADVRLQRRLIPTLGLAARYDLPFTAAMAAVTAYDRIVTSDSFEYTVGGTSYTCFLRNVMHSTQLEIYRASATGEVIVADNVGYIDTAENKIVLLPFAPSDMPDAVNGIRFTVRAADGNTIDPDRNLLIKIDSKNTAVSAVED